MKKFDYSLNYDELDLRKHPEPVHRRPGRAGCSDGRAVQRRDSATLAVQNTRDCDRVIGEDL